MLHLKRIRYRDYLQLLIEVSTEKLKMILEKCGKFTTGFINSRGKRSYIALI